MRERGYTEKALRLFRPTAARALAEARKFRGAPLRVPHHTTSAVSMRGMLEFAEGKLQLIPGECVLAHNGILVLEDLPELRLDTLAAVAHAFAYGVVELVAAGGATLIVPARFQVFATARYCPCGLRGASKPDACRCSANAIRDFAQRVAQRVDMFGGPSR